MSTKVGYCYLNEVRRHSRSSEKALLMERVTSKNSSIVHSLVCNPMFDGGMKYFCVQRAVERLILLYGCEP